MQDLLGTCTRYVPFLARFLHNLAPILARSCEKNVQNLQVIILAAFLAKSCTMSKIVEESCKKRDISRARAKQVLQQDSCTILHDLASSFLLGNHITKGVGTN